jgi:hypothetical protein
MPANRTSEEKGGFSDRSTQFLMQRRVATAIPGCRALAITATAWRATVTPPIAPVWRGRHQHCRLRCDGHQLLAAGQLLNVQLFLIRPRGGILLLDRGDLRHSPKRSSPTTTALAGRRPVSSSPQAPRRSGRLASQREWIVEALSSHGYGKSARPGRRERPAVGGSARQFSALYAARQVRARPVREPYFPRRSGRNPRRRGRGRRSARGGWRPSR